MFRIKTQDTGNDTVNETSWEESHVYRTKIIGSAATVISTVFLATLFLSSPASAFTGKSVAAPNCDYGGKIKWVSLKDSNKLDRRFISDTDTTITDAGIANSSAVLHPQGVVVYTAEVNRATVSDQKGAA